MYNSYERKAIQPRFFGWHYYWHAVLMTHGFYFNERHYISPNYCLWCTSARAFVKQIKLYCGSYGCDKCCQKRAYFGRVTYPLIKIHVLCLNSRFGYTNLLLFLILARLGTIYGFNQESERMAYMFHADYGIKVFYIKYCNIRAYFV